MQVSFGMGCAGAVMDSSCMLCVGYVLPGQFWKRFATPNWVQICRSGGGRVLQDWFLKKHVGPGLGFLCRLRWGKEFQASLQIEIARSVGATICRIGLGQVMRYPSNPMNPVTWNPKLMPVISKCHKASDFIQHQFSQTYLNAGLNIHSNQKVQNVSES